MAVLIEGISVVIRADVLLAKFPGGWDAFMEIVPNQTLCADNEIIRVGFMTPQDVKAFTDKLNEFGIAFLPTSNSTDVVVVDQMRGPTTQCSWLEFGHINLDADSHRVAVCRLAGSQNMEMNAPTNWKFEGSLSSSFGFVPTEHIQKGLKYLRHDNGLDVYLNPVTGKEVYVGRA